MLVQLFLANIELILSGIGLVVIIVLPMALHPDASHFWMVTALVAIVIGLLHGCIFWLVRRRQRSVRNQTLAEVREMLKDIVNNQLTTISVSSHLTQQGIDSDKHARKIRDAVHMITESLDSISDESLRHWQIKYKDVRTRQD